jgi:hypothetical protein
VSPLRVPDFIATANNRYPRESTRTTLGAVYSIANALPAFHFLKNRNCSCEFSQLQFSCEFMESLFKNRKVIQKRTERHVPQQIAALSQAANPIFHVCRREDGTSCRLLVGIHPETPDGYTLVFIWETSNFSF